MNTSNRNVFLNFIWCCLCLFLVQAAFAQTNTATLPDGTPVITSNDQLWTLAIGVVTPLIVQGIKWLVPRIPKALLPISTPLIGLILGIAINKLSAANLSWLDMGKAGALAVFARETWNQLVTKNMASAPQTTPNPG